MAYECIQQHPYHEHGVGSTRCLLSQELQVPQTAFVERGHPTTCNEQFRLCKLRQGAKHQKTVLAPLEGVSSYTHTSVAFDSESLFTFGQHIAYREGSRYVITRNNSNEALPPLGRDRKIAATTAHPCSQYLPALMPYSGLRTRDATGRRLQQLQSVVGRMITKATAGKGLAQEGLARSLAAEQYHSNHRAGDPDLIFSGPVRVFLLADGTPGTIAVQGCVKVAQVSAAAVITTALISDREKGKTGEGKRERQRRGGLRGKKGRRRVSSKRILLQLVRPISHTTLRYCHHSPPSCIWRLPPAACPSLPRPLPAIIHVYYLGT